MSNSNLETLKRGDQSGVTMPNDGANERKSRKRRLRLSCMECRNKKLSCDRSLPCQRCIRTGRPEQCSFETVKHQASLLDPSIRQREQRHSDQIRDLQAEVAELKALLSDVRIMRENDSDPEMSRTEHHAGSDRPVLQNEETQETQGLSSSNRCTGTSHIIDNVQSGLAIFPRETLEEFRMPADITDTQPSDPRERFPQSYYSRHVLLQSFGEIPELFPFIKETANECFKPLEVRLAKRKPKKGDRKSAPSQEEMVLENLLPPKDETDALVSLYLDQLEQLHRIIHIPTFKREYENFWVHERTCCPAMTALILAILSVSTCVSTCSADAMSIPIRYRTMPGQWISACDAWLRQQSPKHHKLVHYQISCLVYLGKRVNMIRKKRFWKETGSLVQDAIMDGLHREESSTGDSPYIREMKRRIWAVIRELDLQNAFEFGLPTLLHNVDSNVGPPTNIEDEDFDETSKELPMSKPITNYTFTSYQAHSSHSLSLRLEISQRLFSTRFSNALCYDDVLRYTHEITQALDAIPSWESEDIGSQENPKLPALAHAFLKFQLKGCILALHRPYLQKNDSKFWVTETVYYHISRDILLLNRKLAGLGFQYLTVLREDLLLASLNLVHVTMLRPKDSTIFITTDSQSTIELLEQCLPFVEDRYLRCCYSEPWCFMTMCAAIMLLKMHLGKEAYQTAKASCARRFLDLHYKYMGRQQISLANQQCPTPSDFPSHNNFNTCQLATPGALDFPASGYLDNSCPELDVNSFNLNMNLDMDFESMWEF